MKHHIHSERLDKTNANFLIFSLRRTHPSQWSICLWLLIWRSPTSSSLQLMRMFFYKDLCVFQKTEIDHLSHAVWWWFVGERGETALACSANLTCWAHVKKKKTKWEYVDPIHYFSIRPILAGSYWALEPIPSDFGQEEEYTLVWTSAYPSSTNRSVCETWPIETW